MPYLTLDSSKDSRVGDEGQVRERASHGEESLPTDLSHVDQRGRDANATQDSC